MTDKKPRKINAFALMVGLAFAAGAIWGLATENIIVAVIFGLLAFTFLKDMDVPPGPTRHL